MNLSGSPFDFLIAFAGGVLASLTPCVYPLIPVSAGYIVGHAHGHKSRALFLSLFYVTGMAIAYSALGILAVLTGSIFGKFSANPVVNLASGIIIFIAGLAMLDLFRLDYAIKIKLPSGHHRTYIWALFLGLVSALMISPCLMPILGAILAYLATKDNIFYGGFLLLCFSYGMGLIFILIGTFGSRLVHLPKSGMWMLVIKKISAVIMLLAGVYFIFTSIRRF